MDNGLYRVVEHNPIYRRFKKVWRHTEQPMCQLNNIILKEIEIEIPNSGWICVSNPVHIQEAKRIQAYYENINNKLKYTIDPVEQIGQLEM